MSVLDVGLLGVMLIAVAMIGYALGRRGRVAPPLVAPAREVPDEPAPPVATAAKPVPSPAPSPPVVAPAVAKPAPALELDALPRMHENEGDELDVTKVGQAATAPPPSVRRTIYHPPLLPIIFDDGAEQPDEGSESMFLVHATAQTDTGLRRKHNEDSVLVLDKANLFVVADGMGGYKGGRLASQLVINTMAEAARSGEYEGPPHEEVPLEASELARAIQMANAEIQETVGRKPDLEGMGTTVCAARFSANRSRLYIGHVGDSRCYRLRDGVFTMMTNDHTMAEHGVKGPESAHLSRAVGIWPTVPIDLIMAVPRTGDVYLICSDGLTKMLNDDIIANVLRSEDHPKAAVDRLILFANSRGGKDNITVILVRVVPPNWKPRSPSSDELVPPDYVPLT
ncbi:MAG TPA: protein phosphatase 2C domain-containing protein [Labilithrix sp.]|nr:protein phosphatase 2C domain-containing protein [Labilithrix sp.]